MTETGGSGGGGGGEVMMWSLRNQNIVSEDNFYIFKSEKEKDWACCWRGGGGSLFSCIIEKKIYKVIIFGYQNELKSIFNSFCYKKIKYKVICLTSIKVYST